MAYNSHALQQALLPRRSASSPTWFSFARPASRATSRGLLRATGSLPSEDPSFNQGSHRPAWSHTHENTFPRGHFAFTRAKKADSEQGDSNDIRNTNPFGEEAKVDPAKKGTHGLKHSMRRLIILPPVCLESYETRTLLLSTYVSYFQEEYNA
jgi:hypothetical protein